MKPFVRRTLFASIFAVLMSRSLRAEDPISQLLRANGYTPVVDHESDLVPGMLLIVNWDDGTTTFLDPETDAAALKLMQPLTRKLTKFAQTKVKGVDAATKGLKAILSFDPAISFSGDNTYTFSGISFNGIRLRTQDWQKLMTSGPTYQAGNKLLHSGRNDVFVITEVDSTATVTISSDKGFSVSGGSSTSSSDKCKAAITPDDNADKGDSKGDDKADTSDTTVKDAQSNVAKADAKVKDGSNGSDTGGQIGLCARSKTKYDFSNDTPVPAALKVARLVLDGDGAKWYPGDYAVPVGDQKLLHRTKQQTTTTIHQRNRKGILGIASALGFEAVNVCDTLRYAA